MRHRLRIAFRSSKPGRLVNRHHRWFEIGVLLVLLLVLLVAIAAAFAPWPGFLPEGRGLAGTVDRSLLIPLVLALAAYFYFYFLTAYRATRELRLVAQRTPEKMFPHAPQVGSANQVFGRDELVKEIVSAALSPDAGPQIVVGGTGSGKTTLLFKLASYLADEYSVVPIVLSLQDKRCDLEDKSFTQLALDRFEELVDPYVKTAAEAEQLWRWMRKRRLIAVLADDLDRSTQVNSSDPYRTRVREALDEARRCKLPLVVTTRPSGLPSGLSELPIDLSEPGSRLEDEDRAVKYVLERAGVKKRDWVAYEDAERLVERNIKEGELLENAFYLSLLANLLQAGALEEPPPGGKHAVRLELLNADRRRIRGDKELNKKEWKRRKKDLHQIESLAVAWLAPKKRRRQTLKARDKRAVRAGERHGLLSLDERRRPQFEHEVLHAYYASRAIAHGEEWKSKLKRKPSGARVRLALVLRAARGGDERFCREACDLLLEEVGGLTPDQRLLRAAGAAELAKAGLFSERNRQIADGCLEAKAGASSVAKRVALKQLELLSGKGAVEALWEYAQDDDYGTRWAAVECLIQRCAKKTGGGSGDLDVVEAKIEEALEGGRELLGEGGGADDWDRRIILLKQVAWMLPSLRTGAEDRKLRERIDASLHELLRLERNGVTSQRGLEASIAQGFKTDAWLNPGRSPDRDAQEMLRKQAVFWYSQLNLVHALALRMATGSTYDSTSLDSILATVKRRELSNGGGEDEGAAAVGRLHPMLYDAARLCKKALKGKAGKKRLRRMKRVVWKDEGVVVARRPRKLDPAAAQLVGEIAVLLNLHETGDGPQRGGFGEKVTLPLCLQRNRRWREFEDGCDKACGFGLCPFQPSRDQPSAHRELSRAFCRDQLRQASFWEAWNRPRPTGARVMPALWRWLETRAPF